MKRQNIYKGQASIIKNREIFADFSIFSWFTNSHI